MKKNHILLLLLPLVFSCSSSEERERQVWGREVHELFSAVEKRDTSFFDEINLKKMERRGRIGEVYKAGKGAAFFLSHYFSETGDIENRLRFLKTELSDGFFRAEAASELHAYYSARGQWRELSVLMETSIEDVDDARDIYALLSEAYYKSGQYAKGADLDLTGEASLYTLLSRIRLNDSRMNGLLQEYLYSGEPSLSGIHFIHKLLSEQNRFSGLRDLEKKVIVAFSSLYLGDEQTFLDLVGRISPDRELIEQYPLFCDFLFRYLRGTESARLVADNLADIEHYSSAFYSARLYHSVGRYEAVDSLFRKAYHLAETDYQRDRSAWYLMDLYKNSPAMLTSLVEEFAPLWNDPSYFSDILGEHLSLLCRGERWDLFNRLYSLILNYGDGETRASYSRIRYFAIHTGRINAEPLDPVVLEMKSGHPLAYNRLIASFISGDELDFLSVEDEMVTISEQSDALIRGFLHFSLPHLALQYSSGREKELSADVLRQLSRLALAEGEVLRSISLASKISIGKGERYDEDDLKLLYPLKFSEQIKENAQIEEIPVEVFLGIIRTESAFTEDIVSRAGAVGLTQLMPATAAEQAQKLGMDNPDLTDPDSNLRIGSAYIRWVLDRSWTENYSQMLIAYNGGGGNLRRWKRSYPRLSDELFAEAIPYRETRNYVKKVLFSSVMYGILYLDIEVDQIVGQVFPDFPVLQ